MANTERRMPGNSNNNHSYITKPKEKIVNDYVKDELSAEMYDKLQDHLEYKDVFQPLEFFKKIDFEFNFFIEKADEGMDYIAIKEHYGSLDLEGKQRYFLLYWLWRKINERYPFNQYRTGIIFKSTQHIINLFREMKEEHKKMFPEISIPKEVRTINSNPFELSITEPLSQQQNLFNKCMPVQFAIDHFKIFTTAKSKNGNPFLTVQQVDLFINNAFLNPGIDKEKQIFNIQDGEKRVIVYHFYLFYSYSVEFEPTSHCIDNYICLLTNNFRNFDFKTVKDNFSKKATRSL